MRTTLALSLTLLIASNALAQATAERAPKDGRYADRLRDEVTARKEFEAASKAKIDARFRSAVKDYKSGAASDLVPEWGEFITADGTQFIALQLAIPNDITIEPGSRLIWFGVVTTPEGKELSTYQESVTPSVSQGNTIVDRSLLLRSLPAVGTFGVADGKQILGMARIEFNAEPLTKTGPGISRIITSSDVHVLSAAQTPFDPFAFGGTKVVPKPGHTFKKSDDVWVFTELRNPALGPDGAPQVTTKTELDGPKRVPGYPTDAQATPLRGVAGHYGIGNTVDLKRLPPGSYKLRVTVTDTIAKQSFTRETTLTVVE